MCMKCIKKDNMIYTFDFDMSDDSIEIESEDIELINATLQRMREEHRKKLENSEEKGKGCSTMNIKDFHKGDKAYLLNFHSRNTKLENADIEEVFVISVGRKFVYVSKNADADKNDWSVTAFAEKDHTQGCLVENKDWGTPNLLFRSKQDIADYQEQERLAVWLKSAVSKRYTLEQLRKVQEILEGES